MAHTWSDEGQIRQREQQMALQAHLGGGARGEDAADQDDVDRFDLSAVVGADAGIDRTLVEQAIAVGKSVCAVGPRRTSQQRFAWLDLAGDQILGSFAEPASPSWAAYRAT
jgi:hypothetical protein